MAVINGASAVAENGNMGGTTPEALVLGERKTNGTPVSVARVRFAGGFPMPVSSGLLDCPHIFARVRSVN